MLASGPVVLHIKQTYSKKKLQNSGLDAMYLGMYWIIRTVRQINLSLHICVF